MSTYLPVQSRVYKAEIRTHFRSKVCFFRGRPINWITDCYRISFVVNGESGRGLRVHSRLATIPNYGPRTYPPIYRTINFYSLPPSTDKFIYLFHEEAARSVPISGGKGASLAMLSILSLSEDIANNTDAISEGVNKQRQVLIPPPQFSVPEGFIISSSAFEKTIQMDVMIEKSIERLLILAGQEKDLQYQCNDLQRLIMATEMDSEITHAVLTAFRSLKEVSRGIKEKDFSVAVRSSCTTEDTVEVSGAGHNDTILGVYLETSVLMAIKQCWASLYSYKSVQYRKNTVQPIRTGIAVVVQKMVPADSAGVLYSQNPSTGDPQESLITGNFGLGDLIMAGEVEPDNFFVYRSYDSSKLSIAGKIMGSKKYMLQLGKKGNIQKKTSSSKGFCLNDDMVLKLSKVGVVLEGLYGHPMDIEWAIKDVGG